MSTRSHGVTRYRLVVYPPGIGETERRNVRVWRGWSAWGVPLWIASFAVITQLIGPWTALLFSTSAYLALAPSRSCRPVMQAGNARTRVRTMTATVMSGYHDPPSRAACRKLQALAATLIEADQHRQLGLISAVEHEMIWWQRTTRYNPSTLAHTGRIGDSGPGGQASM